jgi:hypothetical protein
MNSNTIDIEVNMPAALPNIIVVGAAKSGTTFLHQIFGASHEIFVPEIKECRFFSQMPKFSNGSLVMDYQNGGIRQIEEYLALFAKHSKKFSADISNDYLFYFERSITEIKKAYSEHGQSLPKIIIILRHPISRTFSMFAHTKRIGCEPLDFRDAFNLSQERINNGYPWSFDLQNFGKSFECSQAYINAFEDVLLIPYEMLAGNQDKFLTELETFIGLSEKLKAPETIINANAYTETKSKLLHFLIYSFALPVYIKLRGGIPRLALPFIQKIATSVNYINRGRKVTLSDSNIDMLKAFYKDDISKTKQAFSIFQHYWDD